MNKSIIIVNYSALSKIYLNRFSLFVNSPYFNKQESVKRLHDYLLEQHPIFKEEKCTKEIVFKNVFGVSKYNNQKLKDTISNLLVLFETFLVNEAIKKNKAVYRQLEIQECIDNKLNKQTLKTLNTAFKEKSNLSIEHSKLYYHNYILNDFAYTYQVYNGDRKTSAIHLQKSINSLDKFYFNEKMLVGSAIINRQKILNTNFNIHFFDLVEEIISKNNDFLKDDKIIFLNQQLYLLQKNDDENNYRKLIQLISTININKKELRIYFSFLTNFCIRMINSGKQKYLRELFDLNNKIISKNILLENDVISEWAYKNAIAIALRIKEFDWAENFIVTYSKNLNAKIYLNAYNYNLADIAYAKKSYDSALGHLLNIEYTDVFYLLSSKALLLKIYYETQEFDVLESLLHSFRLLTIRQKKISKKQKDAYLNLIKSTVYLLKIYYKKQVNDIEYKNHLSKLNIFIVKQDSIANKTWILEKIKEFK